MSVDFDIKALVARKFNEAGVLTDSIDVRTYPSEVIVIVHVSRDFDQALRVAQDIDGLIEDGFVTVKRSKGSKTKKKGKKITSVHDERVDELIELLSARSRTSESQPSLRYVYDADERLKVARSPRHHLVFGRRGVGKTALLLEAKRLLERDGDYTLWVNIHSLRGLRYEEAFLTIAQRLSDLVIGALQGSGSMTGALRMMASVREDLESQLGLASEGKVRLSRVVPKLQQALSRFCMEAGSAIYVFLDDVHYLPPEDVPRLLDCLLGITRDNEVWLKVAGIQHQTRWFVPEPPTGLQTGHDASIISLDVTLEKPEKAKEFLTSILKGYLEEANVLPLTGFLSSSAVDRLVLASGGVPRDFLTLCATSLQQARQRANARLVGVQDVNNAAGIAASTKLQELEDDAAAARGRSAALVSTLHTTREYLLNEQKITFFKIDLRDKEENPREYGFIQALADLRMLHLINSSLSDPHQAGRRSEVYLLDLSQYSGSRLKHHLRVLDFEKGHLVLKRTRSSDSTKVGDSPKKLMAILRGGPIMELAYLRKLCLEPTPVESNL
ncbi:ATP-binding protein [Wenzhouxiangella sediminis]|uniref:Orc1-like AAA ATPase domain-containing protein n=1 Tax=Wenzhouxiangella sediminis TaxID=1792836 RepID=A0A3E1K7L7_9GAMM|nr:ATP-binding protein [Wenzhouxiangella sediminis]RFF29983.1 hypothetical protein DZC52_10820 [Wenzhouxiangella sediminis]